MILIEKIAVGGFLFFLGFFMVSGFDIGDMGSPCTNGDSARVVDGKWVCSNITSTLTANSDDCGVGSYAQIVSISALGDLSLGCAADQTGNSSGTSTTTAQHKTNITEYLGEGGNASIVRSNNLTIYQIEADGFKASNFSTNYDGRADRWVLSNYTTHNDSTTAGLLLKQDESAAYKRANFTVHYTIHNASVTAGLLLKQNEGDGFKSINFTTLYEAITTRFSNGNFSSLYDARTDRMNRGNITDYLGGNGANSSLIRSDNLTQNVCIDLTGSIDLCDGNDASGGGGDTSGWNRNNETDFLGGVAANASILRAGNLTNLKISNATWANNASGVNWNQIGQMPSGFADGTDDTGVGGASGISFSAYNYTIAKYQTTSTGAFLNFLNLTLPSTGRAEVECSIWGNSSVATVGIQFELNVTGSSSQNYVGEFWTSATAKGMCSGTAVSNNCAPTASQGLGTAVHEFRLYSVRSGAGVFRIGVRAEAAGTVEIKPGSWCRVISS